jgi:gliding motility-associated-like protein
MPDHRHTYRYLLRATMVIACMGMGPVMMAQCGVPISSFPYEEGFEAAPAWTAGGQFSDWAWGTPAKPIINTPGGGQNSWVVGGLVGQSYNDGQQSWLESPCFDLSGLAYPWISFKIFWETERLYDGLGFQYSLDEGSTWTNLGSTGATPHCLRNNWFNSNNITGLNLAQPKQGWSGRVGATVGNCAGGEGSDEWLTATHCLTPVAGASLVKFRFVFGAGTICNAYDGIAIDDILITEAPPNTAGFTFSCNGSTVAFQDASTPCPGTYSWDFDDPASGMANSSAVPNPVHTFTAPGTYQVRLAVAGPCNAPDTVIIPVTVLGVELEVNDAGCSGNDGSITAVVTGGSGPYTYTWSNGATGAATISGIAPGAYGVVVEAAGACPAEASAPVLQQGVDLVLDASAQDVSCHGLADGQAAVLVSGGAGPYAYQWAPVGGNGPLATGLGPGTYTCTVTDADQCSSTVEVTITEPPPLTVQAQDDVQLCSGGTLVLSASATGGVAPFVFAWSPDGPEISPAVSTTYTVTATDANGCTSTEAQVVVTVQGPAPPTFTVASPQGCAPHCTVYSATGVAATDFIWDFGDGSVPASGISATHCHELPGTYTISLTAVDNAGCSATTVLADTVLVHPAPVAGFLADPPVTTIEEPNVQFTDASVGAQAWQWHFGDVAASTSTEPSPLFTFPEVDCYTVTLTVEGGNGCSDATSATLCVEDAFAVYIPNAFSPNGDGINDEFGLLTSVADPREFELLVFDRWGRVVFRGLTPMMMWDGSTGGTPLPQGVYAWRLRMRDTGGQVRERVGHVTLLR